MMKKSIIKKFEPSLNFSKFVPPSHLCDFGTSLGLFNDKLSQTKSFSLGISNMIYDRPSVLVPEHFFGLYVVVL